MKLFLASASSRRKEIMEMMPFAFEVYVPSFDERAYENMLRSKGIVEISELTVKVAIGKGRCAYEELKHIYPSEDILVLSADTIVVYQNKIFGKGENREKSLAMLRQLNGQSHDVASAVCILGEGFEHSFLDWSKVYFTTSSERLLKYYVDTFLPYDKAGAYGIQDGGALLVDKIEGSYHNIMGLPLRKVYDALVPILGEDCL